ncbi:membrane protein containing ATP-binding region, ATPase-like domain protein [Candidatus Omnitrophus magneticus]|uniref:histidine kinase n=1 Tax=Candidatus Omnitrophus magneticus TaxID=1609969 RepID=A0A0F0CQ02_9BACT|nr:membrane protein containing ATP-binding region, ATPase-like domain protein [Candidatus Omnitrophus magneticus]
MNPKIIFIYIFFYFFINFQSAATERPHNETSLIESYQSAEVVGKSGNYIGASGQYINILLDTEAPAEIISRAFKSLKDIYFYFLEKRDKNNAEELSGATYEVFLTHLRGIYEDYKKNGEYYKALKLLGYLIQIDARPDFYIDRGNIYLYGLNDMNGALKDYEKALEIFPNHETVYTDIGMAYELLGEFDKSIASYKKGIERSPRNSWALYGGKRLEGVLLSREKQMIKDWFFIGPFNDSEKIEGVEEVIISEKNTGKSYKSNDSLVYTWLRPYGYTDFGYVNLNNMFKEKSFKRVYALTYIYSSAKKIVLLKSGSDDGITIWFNGKEILNTPSYRSAEIDQDIVPVELSRGWNEILICVRQGWGGWGFYFRVTDKNGNYLNDIFFSADKDKKIIEEKIYFLARQKFYARLKWWTVAVSILFFVIALIFAISFNIYSAFKTRRMRKDFTDSITHDLRIPLSAIMAGIEMLKDGKIKDEIKKMKYYEAISIGAKRLNRFINQILYFSRAKNFYSFSIMPPAFVVKRSIDIYKNEALSEDMEIIFTVDNINTKASIDEDTFTQAVINLLSNAEKYSLESNKKIEVSITEDKKSIFIKIKDYGIGFKKNEEKKIFHKFFRSDNPFVRSKQGVGLGLAFVKKTIDAHKGKIFVESSPGNGSAFTIILPKVS